MNKIIKIAGFTLALTLILGGAYSAGKKNVSAETCTFTASLMVGSSGTDVTCLQNYLIGAGYSIPAGATGYFGSQTAGAVTSWQSAHNLPAVGVFGPLSRGLYNTLMAALGSGSSGTTYAAGCTSNTGYSMTTGMACTSVTTTLPAGCTSTAGFSPTTGMSCSSMMASLPAGCTSTAGFSPTTGMSCSGTMTLVAGCTSTVGFSSTTGASCSTGTMNNPNLPGSISSTTYVAGYGATQVGVGATGKQVAGIQITTGPGSNINLTSVQLSFVNKSTTAGTYLFNKYFAGVSVWLDGTKVGSVAASSFTESNSVFSAGVTLSGAMIPAGTNSHYLYIAVDALPVIDSANLGSANNTWAVSVNSIRYTDGTGATLQDTTSAGASDGTLTASMSFTSLVDQFIFNTSASATSIKLTVSKDVADQVDRVTIVSSSTSTTNVKLATIDLTGQGAAITIKRLPVTVALTTATSVQDVLSSISLCSDAAGVTCWDSQNISSSATPTSTSTIVTFQLSTNPIVVAASGVPTVAYVFGTVNTLPTYPSFVSGIAVAINVAAGNVSSIQAFDPYTNQLTGTTVLTGSTTGSKVYPYVNGIQVSAVGTPGVTGGPIATYAPPGGSQTHGTVSFTIPFSVTAFGSIAYIPSTATAAASASATNTIQFCIDATAACAAIGTGTIQYLSTDGQSASTNGNYNVPVGQTRSFAAVITYTPTEAHTFRGKLLNVNWSASDVTGSGTWNTFTSGLSSSAFMTNNVAGS